MCKLVAYPNIFSISLFIFILTSDSWRYIRAQDQPELSVICSNDKVCNRYQNRITYKCSVCVEDNKSGLDRCLNTFFNKEWFIDQCLIATKCEMKCTYGSCENSDNKFVQGCFCGRGFFGKLCNTPAKTGELGLRMLQWDRKNAFITPGGTASIHYRAVADTGVMERGMNVMFKTGLGQIINLGKLDAYKISIMFSSVNDAVSCTDNYVDLQFPYLTPDNQYKITILKTKDRLKGYLTHIEARFRSENAVRFISYTYPVFVDYARVKTMNCIPVIQLKNCARSLKQASNFSFRRNEPVTINHNVKYLEDGAYVATARENRQTCTGEDTTWTWTWAKCFITNGFETESDKGMEIGNFIKFNPFKLGFGTYRINLKIKQVVQSSTNENFDECFFQVKPWPLEAVIDGGARRTVLKVAGLTLSATRSFDPNQPMFRQESFRILWYCECLTKNISGCEDTCKSNKKEPFDWKHVYQTLYISPDHLQFNAEYKFTLLVDSTLKYNDKSIAPQYSYVIIKVANESEIEATNYFIECIQNCLTERTLPNELLYLKAKVYGQQGSSKRVKYGKKFSWSYSKGNDTVVYPMESQKLDGLPTSMLAVKPGFLEQGTCYTIKLLEQGYSQPLAEYNFMTISVSYSGECKIDPQSGTRGLTNFAITCDGHAGFLFEYYDKNDEELADKQVFNGRMLGTTEFSGHLECVKLTKGNVVINIIDKNSGMYTIKILKVKLDSLSINEELMDEIKNNFTSTVRLEDILTTMNAISFIPDILPDWVDRSPVLLELIDAIYQIRFHTFAEVKLGISTMKTLLQSLNEPTSGSIDFDTVGIAFVIIRRQVKLLAKVIGQREIGQWISSEEILQISNNAIECLNMATKAQATSTEGISEESANFDTLFLLRDMSIEAEEILDYIKDMLTYTHAPGLPPTTLATADKSFQIWAMGHDGDNPVTRMLWKNKTIPFNVSKSLLKSLFKTEAFGIQLFFQAASIDKNIFSWSHSDVRSKLLSMSVVVRKKKGQYVKKIKLLPAQIFVKIDMDKNLTNTKVQGTAVQLDPSLGPEELDLVIPIHRIDTPPKGYVLIRFLFPQTNESLRVLVTENFRPDYPMMTQEWGGTRIINSSNPEYPINHRSVDAQMFLYMGILPGSEVPVNHSVHYEFQVSTTLCQLWVDSQWSSMGCGVTDWTTSEETICACNHLSIISAAFPVPPQSIDPFSDAKLFLTVLDNPLVVAFVTILLVFYLLLLIWVRYKDNEDQYKGRVIVLDDNFPEDPYPYLVAVHTSARFNSGTTAHVGIKLKGTVAESRAHILSSEHRKVLKRSSDDWFVIFTPKSLGAVYEIHIWHDNYGSTPEWYCKKIIVYDITNGTETIFIADQWLALQEGDYPEARLMIASDQDMRSLKRVFLDNAIIGFRDSHAFLSIFVRHPRSEVTRVQRLSVFMCFIMVAMLCSIMFYKPVDPNHPTDDYNYDVGTKEIIVSVQTVVLTTALTIVVLLAFQRSYKITHKRRRTTLQYRRDQYNETLSQDPRFSRVQQGGQDKSFYDNYVRYVTKYLKGAPLAPVYMQDSEETVQKRKHWYIIAWVSCVAVILGSSYFVMLYGLKLGNIQSKKWLTSLVMAMGEDIFVMGPGKIIFVAVLLSVAFQISNKVDLHGIEVKDLISARKPESDLHYVNRLIAKRNHPMYLPLSSSARRELLLKKDIRQKWWSFMDFTNVFICVIVVSSLISRLWTSHYHGVNHLKTMFSNTHKEEFGSVDVDQINDMSSVEDYFEVTLFEVLFNLHWYNNDPLTTLTKEPAGIQRYWSSDGLHKMIGKPHVRQVRVIPNECHNPYFTKMKKCLLKWSLWNKDTNVYGEHWTPAAYLDTTKEDFPWEYRKRGTPLWWANQRFYGTYGKLYDVSGYYTSIGPTMKLGQKTMAELVENEWQDWYTRACFFSTTVYNVNEQTFTQVTLLFEYFVDGSMYISITVIPVSRVIKFGGWEFAFLIYTFYFLFRGTFVINRMGLLEYLKNMPNVLRLFIIFLSFLAIIMWCFHHRTSMKYAENYMKQQTDEYFDFDNFISTFSLLQVVLSLLLCLTLARSFMLLQGGRRFLNVYYTLVISLIWIYWMTLCLLLCINVLKNLQYFLQCLTYFRIKELIFPQKMTALLRMNYLERGYVQIFIVLRTILMFFIRIIYILLFMYYLRIARVYKIRESDSFNFVIFILDRLKKRCNRENK